MKKRSCYPAAKFKKREDEMATRTGPNKETGHETTTSGEIKA